jgi:hypothetical protein
MNDNCRLIYPKTFCPNEGISLLNFFYYVVVVGIKRKFLRRLIMKRF